eukprot:s320_g35.t1
MSQNFPRKADILTLRRSSPELVQTCPLLSSSIKETETISGTLWVNWASSPCCPGRHGLRALSRAVP